VNEFSYCLYANMPYVKASDLGFLRPSILQKLNLWNNYHIKRATLLLENMELHSEKTTFYCFPLRRKGWKVKSWNLLLKKGFLTPMIS